MSQNTYVPSAGHTKTQHFNFISNVLAAIASLNSGASAPTETYAWMLWADTANNQIKIRNAADDAWITLGTLDQVSDLFYVAGRELSQAQVENAASTVFGLVSGQRLSQAIAAAGAQTAGPIATTSGTAHDFTGLPSGINEVDVLFNGVSLSGTDGIIVQVSAASTFATSGYVSTSGRIAGTGQGHLNSTAGYVIHGATGGNVTRGVMRLRRVPGTNTWVSDHACALDTANTAHGGGAVTLGGTLDGVRITRSGTNTFDAGSVALLYR